MNREITNKLRFVLDEIIPPFIRDSKLFMYPIFHYWFHGKHIDEIMDFKKNVFNMTEKEYENFYKMIHNRADDRETDMNNESVNFLINNIKEDDENMIDIGSGRGYLLKQIRKAGKKIKMTGIDFYNGLNDETIDYQYGFIEKIPMADKSVDVITCTHTIEHILDTKAAVEEMKRVARKKIMIVTPRQRYYYYTLDLHVNFYPIKELLVKEIGLKNYTIQDIQGDWVYIGYVD